jgi:hypothetical protein
VAASGGWFYTAKRTIRAFSTWEYFVPHPEGLHDRLSSYVQAAQTVLGFQVTPSTVFDLTPWSWMVDWFVDIGGLLRYQQKVADNQLVMTRGGFSYWEEITWKAMVSGW